MNAVYQLIALLGVVQLCLGHGGVEHEVNGTAEFSIYVSTLTAAKNFSTFISLLNQTYYQEALNITSGKDRTIFAPTDAVSCTLSIFVSHWIHLYTGIFLSGICRCP